MSDESKTSNLVSLVSLADLGASLRQDFQTLLAASSSGWLDEQPLSSADSHELHAVELEIDDLWRIGGDLLVLAAWLTSGFLPVTQVESLAKEENASLIDEQEAPSTWPPPSSQPTTSRPFRTSAEMTFAEAVAKQVGSPEATASVALPASSAGENDAADQQGVVATTQQPTARPYTPPVIRSLKDLASRLRTSSVDEHALSAESTAERSGSAESEYMSAIARDTNNTARATTALPQADERARTISPTAGPRRTNNFFATTDRISTRPDADFANSPAEPLVLGTTRAVESLARLGIMTSAEAASALPEAQDLSENFSEPPFSSLATEDRRDSTSLSTGSVRSRFALPQLRNSPAPPFTNEGDTVFPTTEDERQRQAPPMPTHSTSAVTQASGMDLAPPDAGDSHSSVTAQRAQVAPHPTGLPEAPTPPGLLSPSERLSTEDVDTLLESLEREIEHEYRRYYRD